MADMIRAFRYGCEECGDLHLEERYAVACCPTPVNKVEVFVCPHCGTEYEKEGDAELCMTDGVV